MADYIPFVNSRNDCAILNQHYRDAEVVRISIESASELRQRIPSQAQLWVDPAVDGYHHVRSSNWPQERAQWNDWQEATWGNWEKCFKSMPNYELLREDKPWLKRHKDQLDAFVNALLDKCLEFSPAWISIPQLPMTRGTAQINKCLAEATGAWRSTKPTNVKLILPVIITGQSTLRAKPSRDSVLAAATDYFRNASGDGIWVVDTSLSDQTRNEEFSSRYDTLIEFHTALKRCLPGAIIVAGPYWGINLVLWTRGLCSFPAISLGTAYTYYISCGQPRRGNIRLAIPPIRRRAVASNDLRDWLEEVLKRLVPSDSVYAEIEQLKKGFTILSSNRDAAAVQVAKFYREWFHRIQAVAPQGRALALYQDLSSAFIIGRQLPSLPKSSLPDAPAKVLKAEKVAEQLMLRCL
jgi:hypothetical protein